MRTLVFLNGSASIKTITWTVDKNCTIKAGASIGTNAVLSREPDLTYASHIGPSVTAVLEAMRINFTTTWQNLSVPLVAGEKVYMAFPAIVGNVVMFVEDDPAE